MTYQPHYLLTWGGQLLEAEEWSNSLRIIPGPDVAPTVGEAQAALDELVPVISAYVESASYSSAAVLNWIKLNPIGPDGRYIYPVTVEWQAPDNTINGTAGVYAPQLAVVVSLRTAIGRGRASRGRYFLPLQPNLGTNGRMTGVQTQTLADDAASFLEQINGVLATEAQGAVVGVLSELGNPGPASAVLRTLVGDVLDTQRRRRNQLPENYAESIVGA